VDYIQLDNLTPRTLLMGAGVLVAGIFLFKATKHIVSAIIFTVIGLVGLGFAFDVLTLDDARKAARALERGASEGLDAAGERARKASGREHGISGGNQPTN